MSDEDTNYREDQEFVYKKDGTLMPAPKLVPQPHGGAIRQGGNPGNKGGGRPPNIIRQAMRGLLDGSLEEVERRFSPEEIIKMSDQDLARYIDTLGKLAIGTKAQLSGPDEGPLSHGVVFVPLLPNEQEDGET